VADAEGTHLGDDTATEAFIARWQGVAASELSTSQSFLIDLCLLLGVAAPHPTPEQDYMFERPITFTHGDGSTSPGRIDLYRRGAFVLESKKLKAPLHTKGFDDALLRARSQAEAYARALPVAEGRPPFVVVVDVGHRIELYAEFSRSGATYTPFPDPRSHRIALGDLRRPEVRERLRRVWTDPLGLDPSRESARVTREIASRLGELARSLEQAGHAPESVAQFLMRCLFTMFAEDVRLLPADSFRQLLLRHTAQPDVAMRMLAQLWHDMNTGGFSVVLAGDVLRFNGKLFKRPDVLPLDSSQIRLLLEAARADWKHVEPAIFGTLLERALSPDERHKLGAHYTPRAYVERLVLPTVIEPLRKEWGEAQAAAGTLAAENKPDAAVAELRRFHHRLCNVRVLDPACGSGNFLYVTLEHLKRLEGEVLNALDELGFRQAGLALDSERAVAIAGETVDPHNLLGIEINPRAAAIAEVVLWIGYLQWHFRTRGNVNPPQPVIRDFRNIENRDAVLEYDRVECATDERGVPVTRWDGETMKVSPVTGEEVPDESARKVMERYVNPRKAEWPEADFVVGNPPFIGGWRMRAALGDGYVDALWSVYPDIPPKADFVMFWWDKAADRLRAGSLSSFGFITTNSIGQVFQRRVIEKHVASDAKGVPLGLAFAVPDHPWVDSVDGAAVRIAMTVAKAGCRTGRLAEVVSEAAGDNEAQVTLSERVGLINADLTIGADVSAALPLRANEGLSSPGVQLYGSGFIVDADLARRMRESSPSEPAQRVIRAYVGGRDLMQVSREVSVIDFFGLNRDEAATLHPMAYQRVLDYVKPERDQNRRAAIRDKWWQFGWERPVMRAAMKGLRRYITTVETAKHRVFAFLHEETLPDNMLINVASDDALILGVLSSVVHVTWALAAGGTLEDRPRYNKTRCFETFPFPVADDEQCARIRHVAEQLDAHRKRQQAAQPGLTLTGMYNVLDKLRSGEALSAKDRAIHEQGLVAVLRQLHDELDEAVLQAYGWGDLLPLLRVAHGKDVSAEAQTRDDAQRAFDEAILERLVALNAQRAAEEARGIVRWLRPEFQNAAAERVAEQAELGTNEQRDGAGEATSTSVAAMKPSPWPRDTVAQVRAVADALATSPAPLSADEIASRFTARGPWKRRLPKLLDMLVALGSAHERSGKYSAR
jgi:hypothetical protein